MKNKRSAFTKWVYQMRHGYFMTLTFTTICTFGVLLTTVSCKSGSGEDEITPTTSTNTGEFFSQCKTGQYVCYGDAANLTLLTSDYKGDPEYQFFFAMKVNKDLYQDLAIIISLRSFAGKGKYSLTGSNAEIQYVQRTAGGQSYQSAKVNGTLEVTDYQPKKYITGVFSIKSTNGTNDLELTEGKFKVEADF